MLDHGLGATAEGPPNYRVNLPVGRLRALLAQGPRPSRPRVTRSVISAIRINDEVLL